MFDYIITKPMGFIIEHIYQLVANYGLAIIIFTLIIKLILIPLNIRSQKAMKKQQKIQPVLQELQKKYANDQEKLQREMMKLYKENNISMAGGCLPMLIQMPVLIGLYQVIQKPISYLLGVNSEAWNSAPFINEVIRLQNGIINLGHNIGNLASYTMEQLANNSQIQLSKWAEIVGTNGTFLEGVTGSVHPWSLNFNFLGLDLSNTPSAAFNYIMRLDFSNWSVIALLAIPVLAVLASYISMKVTQAQSGQNQNDSGQAAQMSKSMNLMMPIMTLFFTITLPAGLGLYWIISSVTQVVQQLALNYYFDKKGEEVVVRIPEKQIKHRKKRKK
ncbi:MAG: YidC/Oxa1 family membrane protein insertase [Clostridia bacterium]|jgi:YidC/Oxa1 family membrane protein insertase|nr:YidC/Oxa1 family membrane protein insertase [Clostridia bacterium]MCI8979481.1 YidC/Oxa1 family membrane protein insertase [Clostridia bacterium]MCI9085834.1 YidC/Oxa1 family membrane protein insertase [Clostridia bacterium]NDO19053.1 YidC/Oxa1 family membrane protein insertase [Lachnospiraceae bacterium MD329]